MNQNAYIGGSVEQLKQRLADNAEAVCRHYLSSGRKSGSYWMVGDVQNNPGASLHVRLYATDARPAGKFTDEATGQHGDLLDIIAITMGLHAFADVLKEARAFLSEPARTARPARDPVPSNSRPAANRLFAASKPIVGTLGEVYLRRRAITASLAIPALRFHPTCYRREHDGAELSKWPAIIAAITTPMGELTGVQRTWLARDGSDKAPFEYPRKAMGDVLGASIQLGTGVGILAAGEGLETMLALRSLLPRLPMIATTSANHLSLITLPASLTRLYIAADNDPPGLAAASRLEARCAEARIDTLRLLPVLDDWNTDLRTLGRAEAFENACRQLHPDDLAACVAALTTA